MIRISNVTKSFDKKVAINNLSIDIEPGLYGLVGQNGAGKSTLFRLISGVYTANNGEILVDSFLSSTKQSKERIFFLPDTPYAPNNADAKDTLMFYRLFYKIDETNFYNLVHLFNLPLLTKIRTYSKGMRRLLFIALALSVDCPILLLDEAFDGLDPLVLETVKYQILKLYEDTSKTIIVSSHNISALEKLVDRFIVIHNGRLRDNGDIEHLGETFVKYQAIFTNSCSEELLATHGLNVVSYRKIGSVINFVISQKTQLDINEALNDLKPTLLEIVPIDASEIIALQMMVARKEQANENN